LYYDSRKAQGTEATGIKCKQQFLVYAVDTLGETINTTKI
jgi:hypothetical protein